jgi:hypothetical protein
MAAASGEAFQPLRMLPVPDRGAISVFADKERPGAAVGRNHAQLLTLFGIVFCAFYYSYGSFNRRVGRDLKGLLRS